LRVEDILLITNKEITERKSYHWWVCGLGTVVMEGTEERLDGGFPGGERRCTKTPNSITIVLLGFRPREISRSRVGGNIN
jgi:hypothetical protein